MKCEWLKDNNIFSVNVEELAMHIKECSTCQKIANDCLITWRLDEKRKEGNK